MGFLAISLFLCFSYWGGPRWWTWAASWCSCVTKDTSSTVMVSAVSDSTFSSEFSTPTWIFSTIPMVKVGCLHRLEGVIYHHESMPACASHSSRSPNKESGCTSVPHDTRTVYNGRLVCITLHVMAQRLWVKFKTVIIVYRLPM